MTQRTPARSIRRWIDSRLGPVALNAGEIEREALILKEMRAILLRSGRPGLTMTDLALGLRMSRSAIRMAFCDLDNVVFGIIRRHLTEIEAAIEAVPEGTPHLHAARRAAYLTLARDGAGGVSENHTILVRDRHALPPDLAEQVETLRGRIGKSLATNRASLVLDVLDSPGVELADIEIMLAGLSQAAGPLAGSGAAENPRVNGALPTPSRSHTEARTAGDIPALTAFRTGLPQFSPLPSPATGKAALLGSCIGPLYPGG